MRWRKWVTRRLKYHGNELSKLGNDVYEMNQALEEMPDLGSAYAERLAKLEAHCFDDNPQEKPEPDLEQAPAPTVPTREQMDEAARVLGLYYSVGCAVVADWLSVGAPRPADPRSWEAGIEESRKRGLRIGLSQSEDGPGGAGYSVEIRGNWTGGITANGRYGEPPEAALWAALDLHAKRGGDGE